MQSQEKYRVRKVTLIYVHEFTTTTVYVAGLRLCPGQGLKCGARTLIAPVKVLGLAPYLSVDGLCPGHNL